MNNKKLQTKKYVKKHINELSHKCKLNRIHKYMTDINSLGTDKSHNINGIRIDIADSPIDYTIKISYYTC